MLSRQISIIARFVGQDRSTNNYEPISADRTAEYIKADLAADCDLASLSPIMLRSAKDSLVYQYSKACMTFHRLSMYRHIGGLPYRHTVGFWVAVAHAGTISGVLMPYRSDKERTCVYHRTLDTTEHTVISAAPILYRQGTV